MKVENLNIEDIRIGILFFGNYSTPYVESSYKELNLVIQVFRPMLDKIDKIRKLIDDSKKLKDGKLYGNCIGENETIISFKKGYFQFYSIVLSENIYLELEKSNWISLLERIKVYMITKSGDNKLVQF